MSVKLNSSGGGSVTLQEPTTSSNFTLTLPAQTANVITDSSGVLNIGSGQIYKDASGNVGIGTSSPAAMGGKHIQVGTKTHVTQLTVNDYSYLTNNVWYNGTNWIADTTGVSSLIGFGAGEILCYTGNNVSAGSTPTLTGTFAVDVNGNLKFNSGYGGVATAYGCRAWVNFNGTGTVAIRASGNVSSITDNGTGDYTVNFTTAMPDVNYCTQGTTGAFTPTITGDRVMYVTGDQTATSSVRVRIRSSAVVAYDDAYCFVAVFR